MSRGVRLDATYTTAYVAHVPLETRAALAEWEGERLTVWTGTQRPFGVRAELAEALGISEERVRVVAPTAGAAFGGKHRGEAAIEAARLALATGHPVKVRWSRAEEFEAAYVRPAAVIDIRSGAGSDGALSAWDFLNIGSGAAGIGCPYAIPNQRLRSSRPTRRCATARTAASPPQPTTSPASPISTSSPTVSASIQSSCDCDISRTSGSPTSSGLRPTGPAGKNDLAWESRAASRRAPTLRRAPS